jgi:hypothetical protein
VLATAFQYKAHEGFTRAHDYSVQWCSDSHDPKYHRLSARPAQDSRYGSASEFALFHVGHEHEYRRLFHAVAPRVLSRTLIPFEGSPTRASSSTPGRVLRTSFTWYLAQKSHQSCHRCPSEAHLASRHGATLLLEALEQTTDLSAKCYCTPPRIARVDMGGRSFMLDASMNISM